MATRSAVSSWMSKRVARTVWSGLLTGDDGAAESPGRLSDRSIQVSGTLGAGGSVNVQGSNDGVTWATLSDPAGTPLATMGLGVEEILENTLFVRPLIVSGDGTTNITVQLVSASTA